MQRQAPTGSLFLGRFTIATWNLQGWGNASEERANLLENAVSDLLASHAIVILQETRSDAAFAQATASTFVSHRFFWTHPPELGAGVASLSLSLFNVYRNSPVLTLSLSLLLVG